ncbi:hypothetical protein BX666DRAFT_2030821 [Dichotomocladium elegans]|nr:hypothetical protein BX666DRAFT_2030821 [Dichotomocladium elegans]
MATAEDTRRHVSTDEQRPRPPKKRFLASSSSSSPSRSIDGESDDIASEDGTDPLMEPYEDFRRDAIFRQWKEYARFKRRSKRCKIEAENHYQSSIALLDVWDSQFQQLRTALDELIPEGRLGSLQQYHNDELYQKVVEATQETAPIVSTAISSCNPIDCGPLRYARTFWTKREASMETLISLLENPSLKRDYQEAFSSWKSGHRSFEDARDKVTVQATKLHVLQEEHGILNRRIRIGEKALKDVRSDLVKAENQLVSKKARLDKKEAAESMDLSNETQKVDDISATKTSDPNASKQQQNDQSVAAIKQTLDRQLREIEVMKDQRIELKQQIVQAEMDLSELPESRIYKSSLIRQLYQAREYERDKSDHLTSLCRKMQADIETLQSERRSFINDRDTEQLNHIKSLLKKLMKLDRELNEVRRQRDALQVIIDEHKNAKGARASLQELELIAETRKERVSILESELLLLQRKSAAMTGSASFYHFVESREAEPKMEIAEQELRILQEQIERAKARCQDESHFSNMDEQIAIALEIKRLQLRAEEFQSKYGFEVLSTDEDAARDALSQKLKSLDLKVAEARRSLESLEKGEIESITVIAQASKGSAALDEQNMEKVRNLMQLEDDISKLQAERSKYGQTFTTLNKVKDANTLVANALNKQVEKELAYIKQLNEREKNMNGHLTLLDRELNVSKAALDMYTLKEDELKETLKDLKKSMAVAKERTGETIKSIMEKIQQIEQGAHERLRVEEDSVLLRRKVEAVSKIDRPEEKELRSEKEAYQALLNCNMSALRIGNEDVLNATSHLARMT